MIKEIVGIQWGDEGKGRVSYFEGKNAKVVIRATGGNNAGHTVVVNGKKEIRKLVEFGVNLDERIADGYYMAKALQLLQYFFDNPELLEEDASKEIKKINKINNKH